MREMSDHFHEIELGIDGPGGFLKSVLEELALNILVVGQGTVRSNNSSLLIRPAVSLRLFTMRFRE